MQAIVSAANALRPRLLKTIDSPILLQIEIRGMSTPPKGSVSRVPHWRCLRDWLSLLRDSNASAGTATNRKDTSLPEQKTAEPELAPWLTAMAELVQRETQPTRLPYPPEITLRLAVETAPLWQKIERDLKLRYGPPYWAVAWAGGLALARHVIDHPALVAGRRVLDFAAGSGIVGIAAAKAGAAVVAASDVDPLAVIAISLNADLNGVAIEANVDDLMPADSGFDPAAFDVVLVGDIFYTPDLAARAIAFLSRCCAAGCAVLIGDPGRADLPVDRLEKVDSYEVLVTRDCQFFGAQPQGASRQDASGLDLRAANVWRFAR